MFISSVVPSARVSLGVFICVSLARVKDSVGEARTLHHTAERIENGLRSKVLGGNQVNKVLLAGFLLALGSAIAQCIVPGRTHFLEDVEHSRIGLLKGGREKL